MGCIGCLTSFCKNVDKGHTVGWERVVCEGRNRETYINDIFIISKMINLSVFCQNTAHMYKRCLLSLSLREMPSSYVIYKRMRGLIAPWLFFFFFASQSPSLCSCSYIRLYISMEFIIRMQCPFTLLPHCSLPPSLNIVQ